MVKPVDLLGANQLENPRKFQKIHAPPHAQKKAFDRRSCEQVLVEVEREESLASGRMQPNDFRVCSGTIGSPRLHQPPTLLEKIGPLVSRLHLVWDCVRQRRFRDLAREARLLSNPVAERRAEPVDGVRFFQIAQHLEQRHVT